MEEQLRILEESIEVWFQKLDLLLLNKFSKDELLNGIKFGVGSCPLCKKYFAFSINKGTCEGCPIFEDVGKMGCIRTPIYEDFPEDPTFKNFYKLITNELNYLLGLKEKLEKKLELNNWALSKEDHERSMKRFKKLRNIHPKEDTPFSFPFDD